MKRQFLDLKPYFNNRLVCPWDTEFDFMNPYYVEEYFKFGEVSKDSISVNFERNAEKKDCVICEGQIIEVPDIVCDRIIIAGNCGWGYYTEYFKLDFDNGTTDYAKASYFDWYWSIEPVLAGTLQLDAEEYKDHAQVIFECDKRNDEEREHYKKCYLYYYVTELKTQGRKLKQIIFPDNIFMNIFAITIESEE